MAARIEPPGHPAGVAFLLSALGVHAGGCFAQRIGALDITLPQAGLLRAIAAAPGQSQQAIAQVLCTPPSRLVALVDSLADRGLVERRRNPADRRLHALYLTEAGHDVMGQLETTGQAHDDAICAALDKDERATLRSLLLRIAEEQQLTPGVHPGYRNL